MTNTTDIDQALYESKFNKVLSIGSEFDLIEMREETRNQVLCLPSSSSFKVVLMEKIIKLNYAIWNRRMDATGAGSASKIKRSASQ